MKWIIKWDTGYGADYAVVEAADEDQAANLAYEAWRQQVEDNADYEALPWSEELAADLGVS